MAALIKCVECGNRVSFEALKCPHCGRYPKHRICYMCGGKFKSSGLQNIFMQKAVCELCANKYSNFLGNDVIEFSCPVCNNIYSYKSVRIEVWSTPDYGDIPHLVGFDCSKCGHPLKFVFCDFCRKPLMKEAAMATSSDDNLSSDHTYRFRGGKEVWLLHKSCYAALQIHRYAENRCERCGLRLDRTFFGKLLGQKFCKRCVKHILF